MCVSCWARTAGSAIMSDELWAVEALDLPDTVASLDDLSYFTGLRSLSLHHGASLDLSVLSRCRCCGRSICPAARSRLRR